MSRPADLERRSVNAYHVSSMSSPNAFIGDPDWIPAFPAYDTAGPRRFAGGGAGMTNFLSSRSSDWWLI
jgi:hypothetical protein